MRKTGILAEVISAALILMKSLQNFRFGAAILYNPFPLRGI